MRIIFIIAIIVAASLIGWVAWASDGSAAVVGTWEGDSKCAVPDSPCRDERALYHLAADKSDPSKLSFDGYKIVDGAPVFMGALSCEYHPTPSTMTCTGHTPKQDNWEFKISGDTMVGTLTIGPEKTLYRRISLRKTSSKTK